VFASFEVTFVVVAMEEPDYLPYCATIALVRDSSGRLVTEELLTWLRLKSRVGDGGLLPVKCRLK
jgi:hypothetical protein